ncbi:MAG: hypothetical protein HC830_06675 [Bacteroidetes bacterium]|nr:hypothetical protein [Bacteroidota bacterium]
MYKYILSFVILLVSLISCTTENAPDFLTVGDSAGQRIRYTRFLPPPEKVPVDAIYANTKTADTIFLDVDLDQQADMAFILRQSFIYEQDVYFYRYQSLYLVTFGNTMVQYYPYEPYNTSIVKTCDTGEVIRWGDTWVKSKTLGITYQASQGMWAPPEEYRYLPFRIGDKYLGWVQFNLEWEPLDDIKVDKLVICRYSLRTVN